MESRQPHLRDVLIDAACPTDVLLAPAVDRSHHPQPPLLNQRRRPNGRSRCGGLPPKLPPCLPSPSGCPFGCLDERLEKFVRARVWRDQIAGSDSPFVYGNELPFRYVRYHTGPTNAHFTPSFLLLHRQGLPKGMTHGELGGLSGGRKAGLTLEERYPLATALWLMPTGVAV